MRSIYFRQFAMVAGLVLIAFLVLGVSFAVLSYRYTMTEQMETLEENASFIGEFVAGSLSRDGDIRSGDLQTYVYPQARLAKSHVLLCDKSGTILYSVDGLGPGQPDRTAIGRQLDRDIASRVLNDGGFSHLGTLGGLYRENRYIAGKPICLYTPLGSKAIGMVFVSSSASELVHMWRNLAGIFAVTSVAVLVIVFLIIWLTTRRQTKPLKEMAVAVRDFGQGDFEKRVDADGPIAEINDLARAFNSMAESLSQAETRRSEFVANISHELKTPMTTIAGFADGILDGTVPPERETAALQTISAETKRLSRLVRRMLDVSRLQSGQGVTPQEQFDIVELTARSIVSLEGNISAKKLDVVLTLPEEPVKVWGDPDAITQVCYNLLDNAIKFSKTGGHLWVEVAEKGPKALVTVRNEGETIPPDELGLIFERFHKSDKSRSMDREGVGLGLYIVKTILNEHKESITVQSEEGRTEFQFTLTLV